MKGKGLKKVFFVLTFCLILGIFSGNASAENSLVRVVSASAVTSAKKSVKKGWVTLSDGKKKRYYKNGKYITGMRKLGGKIYYFNKNGVMQTNCWKTINGKRYYFGKNGVRYSGLKKIGKKTYYFNTYGVMQKGVKKVKNVTYYLDDKGVLEAKKVNNTFYNANGKKMKKTEANDFETLQRAKSIAGQITTPGMTKSQKLEKCFRWVMSKPYATPRRFSNVEGWPAVYANDHFITGRGNCFSDACAFAYLAKAIGCTNVYVCVDSTGVNGSGHSWAEIDGLVYDPLFAEAKSFSGNYGARYGVYILHPILHITV